MFVPTLRGIAAIGLSVVGAILAWASRGDLILWPATLVILGTCALLVAATLSAGILLRRGAARHADAQRHVETTAGETRATGFCVHIPPLLSPFLRMDIAWDDFPEASVEARGGTEWFIAPRRADITPLHRTVTVADCCDLFRARAHSTSRGIRVLPRRVALPAALRCLRSGGGASQESERGSRSGDRFDFRDHRRGDPSRYILWRLSAKSGGRRLLVREPEVAVDPRIGFFLFAGADDEPAAELFLALMREGDDWAAGLSTHEGAFFAPKDKDACLGALCASGQSAATPGVRAVARLGRFLAIARRHSISTFAILLPPTACEEVLARMPVPPPNVALECFLAARPEEVRHIAHTMVHSRFAVRPLEVPTYLAVGA